MKPAARRRHGQAAGGSRTACRAIYSAPQLKGLQEIVTLAVFAAFSIWPLGEQIKWNHIAAFALIIVAAFLLFLD